MRNGTPAEAEIDRAALNVLASGLFDRPYTDEARVASLDSERGRTLALEVAEQSFTLCPRPPGAV